MIVKKQPLPSRHRRHLGIKRLADDIRISNSEGKWPTGVGHRPTVATEAAVSGGVLPQQTLSSVFEPAPVTTHYHGLLASWPYLTEFPERVRRHRGNPTT
jgi:hypothetical protein